MVGARAAALGAGWGRRRLLSGVAAVAARQPVGAGATLGDLLSRTKPVVTVRSGGSVQDAVKKMTTAKVGTLFVEDESGVLVGIVKEKGIIACVAARGPEAGASMVTEVMDKEFAWGGPSTTVREALELLHRSKQDHLPIVVPPESGSSARQVRALDATSLLSSKHIIGQYYYELVGAYPEQLSAEERAALESELAGRGGGALPTVKMLIKTKEEANKSKGSLGTMVLNTLAQDRISVAECIKQMHKFQLGSVAVMDVVRDETLLKGIATEQDIVRRVLGQGRDPAKTPLVDIMTSQGLATVTTKETLLGCAYKMIEANVRHLPVVSPKGSHILAIVSSKDVVAFFVETWSKEAR